MFKMTAGKNDCNSICEIPDWYMSVFRAGSILTGSISFIVVAGVR